MTTTTPLLTIQDAHGPASTAEAFNSCKRETTCNSSRDLANLRVGRTDNYGIGNHFAVLCKRVLGITRANPICAELLMALFGTGRHGDAAP